MSPPNEVFVTDRGASVALRLDKELGSGNYGTVYRLGRPFSKDVIKIYNDTKYAQDVEAKVDFMLGNRPADASVKDKGRLWHQLAWPQRKAVDRRGLFVGYTMPEINENESECLHFIFSETERKTHNIPEHYGFRLIVARNLAAVFDNLHSVGICILDVKPDNIRFYKESGYICLLDCDSFIPAKGSALAAGAACTAGYILPEATVSGPIDDPSYQVAHFRDKQDDFALSILIFRLMNDGYHPFSGVPKSRRMRGLTEQERIFAGGYSFGSAPNSEISPPPLSLHKWLDASTRAMFDRAFASRNRPTANDWLKHLDRFVVPGSKDFVPCAVNSKHMHFQTGCGLCAREQTLSKLKARAAPRTPPVRSPGPAVVAAARPAQPAMLNPHPAPALPVPPPPPQPIAMGTIIGWAIGGLFALGMLSELVSCASSIISPSPPPVQMTSPPVPVSPSLDSTQPEEAAEPPPQYRIQPFPAPILYLIDSPDSGVWIQLGPGRDYASGPLLRHGDEVTGNGSTIGEDGVTWISITGPDGTSGFIMERLLRAAAVGGSQSAGPSFACSGTLSWDERAICDDADLAAKDRQMVSAYRDLLASLSGPNRQNLMNDQAKWLRERRDCPDSLCLSVSYYSRIRALQSWSSNVPIDEPTDGRRPSGPRQNSLPQQPVRDVDQAGDERARVRAERARPRADRAKNRAQGAGNREGYVAPAEGPICILPSGQEARVGEQRCRELSGVIYK